MRIVSKIIIENYENLGKCLGHWFSIKLVSFLSLRLDPNKWSVKIRALFP